MVRERGARVQTQTVDFIDLQMRSSCKCAVRRSRTTGAGQAGHRPQMGQANTRRVDSSDPQHAGLQDPASIGIEFTPDTSIEVLAERVADAINSAGFRVSATVVDERIYLTNAPEGEEALLRSVAQRLLGAE